MGDHGVPPEKDRIAPDPATSQTTLTPSPGQDPVVAPQPIVTV
jgi:hypothetical protein